MDARLVIFGGLVGIVGALLGVVIGHVLEAGREEKARVRDYRLAVIDDTQRYTTTMLHYAMDVVMDGREQAGQTPNPGDFPKMDLSYIGDAELVRLFTRTLSRAGRRPGVGFSKEDLSAFARVGGQITGALREQSERILRGDDPLLVPEASQNIPDTDFDAEAGGRAWA